MTKLQGLISNPLFVSILNCIKKLTWGITSITSVGIQRAPLTSGGILGRSLSGMQSFSWHFAWLAPDVSVSAFLALYLVPGTLNMGQEHSTMGNSVPGTSPGTMHWLLQININSTWRLSERLLCLLLLLLSSVVMPSIDISFAHTLPKASWPILRQTVDLKLHWPHYKGFDAFLEHLSFLLVHNNLYVRLRTCLQRGNFAILLKS